MKKIFLFALFASSPVLFSSCYFSYSCTCQYKTAAGRDSTFVESDMHTTQSGALHECNVQKQRLTDAGNTVDHCVVPI